VLAFENISKSYTVNGVKKQIFKDLSVEFPSDKNIAILGKNGAGKSTMMRLLAGSEPPDSGRVIREGRISWPLGFAGGFNGSMTGLENVRFVSRIYGQDTKKVVDYVEDFAELGKSLHLPIKTYSSGMKARLAFGLSMAVDFDIYLIDEITAVGDSNFRKKSSDAFKTKLNDKQIILVSHSETTIREYCNGGVLVNNKEVHAYQDIDTLFSQYHNTIQ